MNLSSSNTICRLSKSYSWLASMKLLSSNFTLKRIMCRSMTVILFLQLTSKVSHPALSQLFYSTPCQFFQFFIENLSHKFVIFQQKMGTSLCTLILLLFSSKIIFIPSRPYPWITYRFSQGSHRWFFLSNYVSIFCNIEMFYPFLNDQLFVREHQKRTITNCLNQYVL